MKSRKSVPKWKSESQNIDSKPVEVTRLQDEKYSSFVSGISDCSCDQKVLSFCVEENYEKVLQEFIDSLARLAKAGDARQIGAQCLEYVNVILFNIEWSERERSRIAEEAIETDKNLDQIDRLNVKLKDEIEQVQKVNSIMKDENDEIVKNFYQEEDSSRTIYQQNNSSRLIIETQNTQTNDELDKLANASSQVEEDIVQKEVQWDKINFYLEKRLDELQSDHEALKADYQLLCNTLQGNRGDRGNDELDIGVLEACYEAEMVMMKHAHESFISELNKLNYQLWNEKFFARSRLDEETKKCEYYESWIDALKAENDEFHQEMFCLNKEVEALLDVICLKIKSKCCEKVLNDRNICLDIR